MVIRNIYMFTIGGFSSQISAVQNLEEELSGLKAEWVNVCESDCNRTKQQFNLRGPRN